MDDKAPFDVATRGGHGLASQCHFEMSDSGEDAEVDDDHEDAVDEEHGAADDEPDGVVHQLDRVQVDPADVVLLGPVVLQHEDQSEVQQPESDGHRE